MRSIDGLAVDPRDSREGMQDKLETLMKLIRDSIKKLLPSCWLRPIHMARIANLEGKEWHMLWWRAPATYRQDGLLTVHATGFDKDARFQDAYAKGKATGSWRDSEVQWRAYIACWAGRHALSLGGGDFVEAGTNRGGTAMTMINYLGAAAFADRHFYLLDTFKGLEEAQLSKTELHRLKRYGQSYKECYDEVKATFRDHAFVELVRGPIPDTLPTVPTERIVFLHIDLNSAKPEVETLRYFWDRIVKGGIVLFDDYGWYEAQEQRKALDDLATELSVKILALPTGQGFLIKQ